MHFMVSRDDGDNMQEYHMEYLTYYFNDLKLIMNVMLLHCR